MLITLLLVSKVVIINLFFGNLSRVNYLVSGKLSSVNYLVSGKLSSVVKYGIKILE